MPALTLPRPLLLAIALGLALPVQAESCPPPPATLGCPIPPLSACPQDRPMPPPPLAPGLLPPPVGLAPPLCSLSLDEGQRTRIATIHAELALAQARANEEIFHLLTPEQRHRLAELPPPPPPWSRGGPRQDGQ